MLNWENSTERFAVIANNKIMDTQHGVISLSYNDLRKIWYDGCEELSNEEWIKIVNNTPELKEAFDTVVEMYINIHNCIKQNIGNIHLYRFEV
jgi:hypothetical protein